MPGPPPVKPGDVLRLGEDDYRFGVGPLTLRVTGLIHVQHLADGPWLYLRGVSLRRDGTDREPRQVLVRLAALTPRTPSTTPPAPPPPPGRS